MSTSVVVFTTGAGTEPDDFVWEQHLEAAETEWRERASAITFQGWDDALEEKGRIVEYRNFCDESDTQEAWYGIVTNY